MRDNNAEAGTLRSNDCTIDKWLDSGWQVVWKGDDGSDEQALAETQSVQRLV